jgi:hypothetical protein
MTIEQVGPCGAWMVSALVKGRLVNRIYYDVSRDEAVAAFRETYACDE